MTLIEHPKPNRVQRHRTRGWRKPQGAIIVDRTTRYGNPWPVDTSADPARGHTVAVDAYRRWLRGDGPDLQIRGRRVYDRRWILAHIRELAGHQLCCACPPEMACHADVLAQLASEHQGADAPIMAKESMKGVIR